MSFNLSTFLGVFAAVLVSIAISVGVGFWLWYRFMEDDTTRQGGMINGLDENPMG